MKYVSNAFSLNMLPTMATPQVRELTTRPELGGFESVVGHEDTANLLGLSFNRQSVVLVPGDTLVVAQYNGSRLPEGATELPEGASFRWVEVTL